MKTYLVLSLLLTCTLAFAQQKETVYYNKSGKVVPAADNASKMVVRTGNDKKFSVITYQKKDDAWLSIDKCLEVKKVDEVNYKISHYKGRERTHVTKMRVLDTLSYGCRIYEELKNGGTIRADVKKLFPRIYHGSYARYNGNKEVENVVFLNNAPYGGVRQRAFKDSIALVDTQKVERWARYPGAGFQLHDDLMQALNSFSEADKNALPDTFFVNLFINAKGYPTSIKFYSVNSLKEILPGTKLPSQLNKRWMPAVNKHGTIDYAYLFPFSFTDGQIENLSGSEVFFFPDERPEFPGGEAGLRRYIAQSVRYPAVSQENGIQGRVYVSFVVNSKGYVQEIKLARGVDSDLDYEAIRVVKQMPRWKPGKQDGKVMNVPITIPINFVLQ